MLKNTCNLLYLAFVMPFCSIAQKSVDNKAVKIIQMSVEAHGGKKYQNFDISFDFRQYRVRIKNNMSLFEYERTTQDSLKNTIRDVLNNTGFTREINGKKQNEVADILHISLSCAKSRIQRGRKLLQEGFMSCDYKLNDKGLLIGEHKEKENCKVCK